ncbi:hypothetical protein KXW38_010186, partial [Aspergillus fumigatus]
AFWVGRYLAAENNAGGYGRDHSTLQRELFMETDSRKFFSELMNERRNYCITHVSKFNSSVWKEVHIHQSLNESVVILKRDEARCPSPPRLTLLNEWPANLIAALDDGRSRKNGGFTFTKSGEPDEFVSWDRLRTEVIEFAARLRGHGLKAGDRLTLVIAAPRDFVPAFLGA